MRFVVLHHLVSESYAAVSGRGSHYDLMLERDTSLQTWALETWPLLGPGEIQRTQPAWALPDHRLHYLNYEGEIEGDRGLVRQVVAGTYRIISSDIAQLVVVLQWPKAEATAAVHAPLAIFNELRLTITPATLTASIVD